MANPTAPIFTRVSLEDLEFDPRNPRFGGGYEDASQTELQAVLENEPHYALQLVDSFITNGYIDYEPLVVRRGVNRKYIVVEGNRRLAALKHIKSNPEKYSSTSPKILSDLDSIPVLVFSNALSGQEAQEQRVYLGVRHLFGFRDWPPESKARFLAASLDETMSVEQTAKELNIARPELKRYVIPYRLREDAKSCWKQYRGVDFWLFGEALARSQIKEFLKLLINNKDLTIESYDKARLKALLVLLYGEPGATKSSGAVAETRSLSGLAKIINNEKAMAEIRKGKSIEEAQLLLDTQAESEVRLLKLTKDVRLIVARVRRKRSSYSVLKQASDALRDAVTRYCNDKE